MVALLVPIALFLSFAFAAVGVTQIISDGRTRRRLLESNATPEMAAALVSRPPAGATAATLKWGLVLATTGVALIILQFLPYDEDDPIAAGIVLLAAALGMLAGYAVDQGKAARDARSAFRV